MLKMAMMMVSTSNAEAETGCGHEIDPMDACYDKIMEKRTNRNKAIHKAVSQGLRSRHNLRLQPFWTHFLPQQLRIFLAEDDDST